MAPQSILLWKGEEVEKVLHDEKIGEFLEHKYRWSVEEGVPDASIQELTDPESLTQL
jgi:hypothetical protein